MAPIQPGVHSRVNSSSRERTRVVDVVHTLLSQEQGRPYRLLVLSENQATLRAPTGKLVRVLATPRDAESLESVLEQSQRNNQSPGTDVILVGGSSLDRSRIEQAFPSLQMTPFRVAHLAHNGTLATYPPRKSADLENQLAEVHRISESEEEELLQRAEQDERAQQQDTEQRSEFFALMRKRPARFTPIILGMIAVVFVAQISWFPNPGAALSGTGGALDSQQWLLHTIRMGALYSPLVAEGQWWRMLTAGFMHHGLMHVAVNSFALYILGRQLEKVLGGTRFLIVYAAALIGGSVGSYYFTDGISVGASGAIWGLLGAQLSLAYGRPPVLPHSIAAAIRPLAMQNVLLNVFISLVPGIDWAAHFGGGVAGGAVLASGILYVRDDPDRVPGYVSLLAGLSVLILLAGAGLCLFFGYFTRGA